MSRAKGESVVVPVVFTGALGTGPRRQDDAAVELVHGVSRTPQVWIDCQALEDGATCNVNWDVREGTIPPAILQDMWESFTQALDRLADDESVWQVRRRPYASGAGCRPCVPAYGERTPSGPPRRCTPVSGIRSGTVPATSPWCTVAGATRTDIWRGYVQALDPLLSGIGEGDRVAIVLGKSVWQVAAVLAVLSRGAIYVPIDHDQPAARQERMVSSATRG